MNYTEEQFQTLAPFEGYFRTATRSGYAGYVGFRNAEKIDKIIREAGLYKSGARTNYACASCVLRILRIAGKAWFEDQEARIAAANDAEAAKLSAAAQEPVEEPAQEPEPELEPKLEPKPEQTAELSAQQALDESAANPSLDVEVDGDIVEVTATYLAPEPAPAEEPEPEPAAAAAQEAASAPSTPKEDPTPAKTSKAAKTAPKSKTAKK